MKWYDKAKRLMAYKKIRQEDLLEVFGVTTRGAVGHYLAGRRQPDPGQMKALANKLGCGLDELLSEGEIDLLQLQINKITQFAEIAIATSSQQITEDERWSIYRVAFAAGLDMNITDEQLTSFLASLIKK